MKKSLKTGFVSFFISILFLVFACNAGGYKDAGAGTMYQMSEMPAMPESMSRVAYDAIEDDAPITPAQYLEGQGIAQTEQARKLVKRAELNIRVDDPALTEKPLADLMAKYGAWSASAGIYENSRNYTIRVSSLSYDSMLAELADLGKVLWRTENTEDVTLRYYDLESRLATRRELLRTYQSYLGRANNIEEIMTVESWISNLQREIDQTGTQFRNLASLVDYSTIELNISGPVAASSYSRDSLGEKLRELFSAFGDVASSALVVLTGIVIYGVPAILILILLFWLLFGRVGLIKKVWRLAAGKK